MLGTFTLLTVLGLLAALAWAPWWGLASVFGAGKPKHRRPRAAR